MSIVKCGRSDGPFAINAIQANDGFHPFRTSKVIPSNGGNGWIVLKSPAHGQTSADDRTPFQSKGFPGISIHDQRPGRTLFYADVPKRSAPDFFNTMGRKLLVRCRN
jgi:hypothetical protein